MIYPRFKWWFGIVEDINDPLQVGRVRVRVIGYYSNDENELPTDTLNWFGVVGNAISGVGTSPTMLVNGSTVAGFFTDGDQGQQGIVIGNIAGIPKNASQAGAFNDPNKEFPKSDYVGRSDVNKLATGDTQNTSIASQNASRHAIEPSSPYGAKYPDNHVMETVSGHVKEYDDTDGAERIREWHKSGTYYEIHPDGNKVLKIVGTGYTIILKDDNVAIDGTANVTIGGDLNLNVGGNATIDIGGNLSIAVGGSMSTDVGGSSSENSGGSMTKNAPRINLN